MSATVDGFTGAVNDVGVITLPSGRHAVVAVFVKATRRPVPDADAAIASIARRVFDYWGPPAAR
jgi:beta-lactamase class A